MINNLTMTQCTGKIKRLSEDYLQIECFGFWLSSTMHELICQKFGVCPIDQEISITYNLKTGYVVSVEEPIL